jgi:hypothetical protein
LYLLEIYNHILFGRCLIKEFKEVCPTITGRPANQRILDISGKTLLATFDLIYLSHALARTIWFDPFKLQHATIPEVLLNQLGLSNASPAVDNQKGRLATRQQVVQAFNLVLPANEIRVMLYSMRLHSASSIQPDLML